MKKCENKNCIMRTESKKCYLKVLDNSINDLNYDFNCNHEIVGIKNIVEEITKLREELVL